ncbi:MAG: hypothetical protein ACPG1A_01080 [Halioglobus sp.]
MSKDLLTLQQLNRRELVTLAREFMLHGHLQDRVGLPNVMGMFGEDSMTQIAIEEWWAASPIYSQRMQEVMKFPGDTVRTLVKNLQLDIGFAHQFMDVGYKLISDQEGEFWLKSCGALMDAEPYGEDRVKNMCHDIEDPTFDATAAATNPRMKIRAFHRPPRTPADRNPHCHWKMFIDEESTPYEQHANLEIVRQSCIASVAIDTFDDAEDTGGLVDYSGDFEPDFQLESLSSKALLTVMQEFCVQSQLLARAFLLSLAQRHGEECVREIAIAQSTGICGLTAGRIHRALGMTGKDDLHTIAQVLQLHPVFYPRTYIGFDMQLDADSIVVSIADSPAFTEGDNYNWFVHLTDDVNPVLDAIALAINPRATCQMISGESRSWRIRIDDSAAPRSESNQVELANISTGASIIFREREFG